jgi:hypothetical protein
VLPDLPGTRATEHELGALPFERPSGEDHRDVQPGYDLDEQGVYADRLRRSREGDTRPDEDG